MQIVKEVHGQIHSTPDLQLDRACHVARREEFIAVSGAKQSTCGDWHTPHGIDTTMNELSLDSDEPSVTTKIIPLAE